MKKIFGIVSIVLVFGLTMVGCSMDIDDGAARATASITHDGVTWTADNATLAIAEGNTMNRTNSSGISIPSNAHSVSFATLTDVYFTWAGNGQSREFFAYTDAATWARYCWVGVTTQQGPHGYQHHFL
jgi:hypothetical protein